MCGGVRSVDFASPPVTRHLAQSSRLSHISTSVQSFHIHLFNLPHVSHIMNLRLLPLLTTFLLSLILLVTTTPPPRFHSVLHTLQHFAADLYPSNPAQQHRTTLVLSYLFRSPHWEHREHYPYMSAFLRTGGLQQGYLTRDAVRVGDAVVHLMPGTVLWDVRVLRPTMGRLVEVHEREARRWARGRERSEGTGPDLGQRGEREAVLFAGVPEPLSMDQAEALVGDVWRRGRVDRQQQTVRRVTPPLSPGPDVSHRK